jgi:hypothetical protein
MGSSCQRSLLINNTIRDSCALENQPNPILVVKPKSDKQIPRLSIRDNDLWINRKSRRENSLPDFRETEFSEMDLDRRSRRTKKPLTQTDMQSLKNVVEN